ncbi:helix-turn-helix domain-containing protein [Desulfurobacterium sp.]|uniref:helix-turn-helix domain-containing protein n=1 Tax=Desulfurobacterium sp. TaxID=2004706 RepID=UPI002603BFF9|nr:helix-turn-helix domain-containing protein [Desulfurobacterium sp.]
MEKFDPSKLRKLRKKKNLTQEELAEILGVHPVSYARWESGLREPKAEYVIRLAKILGTSPEYFFKEEQNIEYKINNKKIEKIEFPHYPEGNIPYQALWIEIKEDLCNVVKAGDILLVAKVPLKSLKNGEKVLISKEGKKEIRRYFMKEGTVFLIPMSDSEEIIILDKEKASEMEKHLYLILGKYQPLR